MPKKKQPEESRHPVNNPNVMGLHAAVVEQPITDTLETNYMPYAMSVIVSRAIPEIDGFKPSHRKLLYTMYKMGLLTGARTKSANIVGQTMRLNPHGDAAIYDTMVRLSKGYGALLTPFVDSKGNFGKCLFPGYVLRRSPVYGGEAGAPSAARFSGTSTADTVDFVDNYDNTMKEPALLPTTFPNILCQRQQRHCRGHGLPVLRLQPEGGLRHHHCLPEEPGLRPDGDAAGTGFPHRRRTDL